MYMRYVEAIKKTVQKISDPAARKIASEKEKAINEMATIFHKNQQIKTPEEQKNLTKYVFNKLSTNGKVLIPSFSTNHAMLMEIFSTKDEKYTVRIYNSSDGIQNHHEKGKLDRKFNTYAEYKVSSIKPGDIDKLLGLKDRSTSHPSKADQIYDWINDLPGSEKVKLDKSEITWQTHQKGGDCSLEAVNSYLRDSVIRSARQVKHLAKPDNNLGLSLYREMKAAYLREAYSDYVSKNAISPEMAPYLESLKMRANRTEIAARMGNRLHFNTDLLAIGHQKEYLRLFTQVATMAKQPEIDAIIKGAAIKNIRGYVVWFENKEIHLIPNPAISSPEHIFFIDTTKQYQIEFDKNAEKIIITKKGNSGFELSVQASFKKSGSLHHIDVTKSKNNTQFSDHRFLNLATKDVSENHELKQYLSVNELNRLANEPGDVYLDIEYQPGSRTQPDHPEAQVKTGTVANITGVLLTKENSAVTHFRSGIDGKGIEFDPVINSTDLVTLSGRTLDASEMEELFTKAGLIPKELPPYKPSAVFSASSPQVIGEVNALKDLKFFFLNKAHEGSVQVSPVVGADGSTTHTTFQALESGLFSIARVKVSADGKTLDYLRRTLSKDGTFLHEEGQIQPPSRGINHILEQLRSTPLNQLASALGATQWRKMEVTCDPWDRAAGAYKANEEIQRPDGTISTLVTQTERLSDSQVESVLNEQIPKEVHLSGKDAAAFRLDPQGEAVDVVVTNATETLASGQAGTKQTQTRYSQKQEDGSTRVLVRTEVLGSRVEWKVQDISTDGNLREITLYSGTDARSERTAVTQTDHSLKEVLVEESDTKAAFNPDQSVRRTERTTSLLAGGGRKVVENSALADSLANASPGGHASRTEHEETLATAEMGPDGIARTKESSSGWILNGGELTTMKTETSVAHGKDGDRVERTSSEITTPTGTTVQSETQNGRTTEAVKVGDAFVSPEQAPQTAEVKAALAMQDLARSSVVSSWASDQGLEAVAPLLGDTATLSSAPSERPAQLQKLLETRAATSMQRVYATGALAAGGGAMALYQGVMGISALRDGLKAGDNYLIGMGATGLAAGGAQVAELGLQGASLMASSSRALATLSKVGSVAGKLALGLGVVAMGMSIPGLVNAIKRGDTKAIVSNSVGLGGGLAAMVVAGATAGSLIGAAVGLLIGGLVIGFVELFNKLFRPGTPIQGADPLLALPQAERTQALQAAQTLLSNWDGSSLSEDRLKELSASGPNEAIKAAAQFFVDHPTLRQWMDAANAAGGNLEKRDARFDGHISKSDLVRYIGYMAVPPEIYQTLPAPSLDARLWAVGIIDLQTHEQVVDEFGKDGEGQGSGDGAAGLPEYANIASGAFDERTRELLQQRYAGESDEQITQHLTLLKKACAYLAAYPSELRALDSFKKPGQEDGKVGTVDLEMMRQANQTRINELWAAYPNGLPSFNDNAQAHTALGINNPALWRPDRFDNPNPDRPQSYYQVMLDHAGQIDANLDGQLDWAEMANAREQALQQQQYGLYYALDYIMRNGADLFQDRGEGTRLQLSKADLALKAAQDKLSATPQQEQAYWALLQQHFDEIELLECPTNPADGQASLGDLKAAQQKYLEQGNWDGYYAVGWVLLNFSAYANTSSLLAKDAVQAGAAKSLLNANLAQIDQADGTPDGQFSLDALETTRAHCEQTGQTQDASNMAWLIQDYRNRTERLAASLDVDEGMKRDSRPADNLISIEGDVRKQLEDHQLSDADHQALQHFLDHAGQIAHYGDKGDIVSTQDFSRLLGGNLQWFGV